MMGEDVIDTARGANPEFSDKGKAFFDQKQNYNDIRDSARPEMEKICPKLISDLHSTTMTLCDSYSDKSHSLYPLDPYLMEQISILKEHKAELNAIKNMYRTTDTSIIYTNKLLVLGVSKTLMKRVTEGEHKIKLKKKGKEISILLRPSVQQFIYMMSCFYDIIIFSEYSEELTKEIINLVDEHQSVKAIYTRKHCDKLDHKKYAKDLRRVTTELKKVIFVDSNLSSFALQPSNGLYVRPFDGIGLDFTLKDLGQFLLEIHDSDDFRSTLRAKYKYIDHLLQI